MKKKELLMLHEGLNSKTLNANRNSTFLFNNSGRKRITNKLKEQIKEAGQSGSEYQEYLRELKELQKDYILTEKDSKKKEPKQVTEKNLVDGQMTNVPVLDPKKADKYYREWEKLKKKHKEAIDEWEAQRESYKDLLEEEIKDLKIAPLKPDDIHPKVTLGDMIAIFPIYENTKRYKKAKVKLMMGEILGNIAVGAPADQASILRKLHSCSRATTRDFVLKVAENYHIISKKADELKESPIPKEFEEKVVEKYHDLSEKWSEKDINGSTKIVTNTRMTQDGEQVTNYVLKLKEGNKLDTEYNEILTKESELIDKYEDFLQEEVEVELNTVTLKELEEAFPSKNEEEESSLTSEITDALYPFII